MADLEGGPRGPAPPPPFLTKVYNVYHFEGQRINNVTLHLLNLIKKVQIFQKFLLASLAKVIIFFFELTLMI